MLRALIARTFGINVRKRKMAILDGEGEDTRRIEISDGDGSRELGWFIQGRKGTVIVE